MWVFSLYCCWSFCFPKYLLFVYRDYYYYLLLKSSINKYTFFIFVFGFYLLACNSMNSFLFLSKSCLVSAEVFHILTGSSLLLLLLEIIWFDLSLLIISSCVPFVSSFALLALVAAGIASNVVDVAVGYIQSEES